MIDACLPMLGATPAVLAAWVHDLDPYAIKLWAGGPIRWYGLSYLVGFVLGYALIRRVCRVGRSPLEPQRVADLVVMLAFGVVIGGRLGYVIFYKPELMVTFWPRLPFWGVLAIQDGGMASHGGILGTILAAWWFARRQGISWLYVMDLMAFAAPLGLGLGRVANFINGELYGRRAAESLPWAVRFPQELLDNPELATQALLRVEAANIPDAARLAGAQWEIHEIIHAIQAGNRQVIELVGPLLTARHPSQLYAALLEGLVVFLVLLWLWRKPRTIGIIGGSFCIGYGLMRILNEFYRMPDAHLLDQEFAALGVTRGQWLSMILVLVGAIGIPIVLRRRKPRLGSWRRGPWTGQRHDDPPDPHAPSPT